MYNDEMGEKERTSSEATGDESVAPLNTPSPSLLRALGSSWTEWDFSYTDVGSPLIPLNEVSLTCRSKLPFLHRGEEQPFCSRRYRPRGAAQPLGMSGARHRRQQHTVTKQALPLSRVNVLLPTDPGHKQLDRRRTQK
jgi:hypothetical protein